MNEPQNTKAKRKPTTLVSTAFDNGVVLEAVYDSNKKTTAFAVWKNGSFEITDTHQGEDGTLYVPYRGDNNLIQHQVVLLPSKPEEYGAQDELIKNIQEFIHRYVDVNPSFEIIASYYVLLSWIYEGFNELPYLRVTGTYGSGKTRFLLAAGALCYKPIFASGASSIASIFHMLDIFRGTLLIDEGDFRFSDEKADIVKILNNGNVKGFPILRCEVNQKHEFHPRAFEVYGPKIVATRSYYDDPALESRFITEEMGQRHVRSDVPISLPASYREEALRIRNKLLLYRFHHLGKQPLEVSIDPNLDPRLRQIFSPLLALMGEKRKSPEVDGLLADYHREMILDRGMEMEAELLEVIFDLFSDPGRNKVSVKDITDAWRDRYGRDYGKYISPKSIGTIIRKRLKLHTHKSHGVYVIPMTERHTLERLFELYGISKDDDDDARDFGDLGT